MKYKIADIIKEGNYQPSDWQSIVSYLRNSEKYKNNLSTHPIKGEMLECDINEVLADLRKGLDAFLERKREQDELREDEKQRARELLTREQNEILKDDIRALKNSLADGDKYYEYKTIVIKDSEILGTVDSELIENTLNKYALEGWRLKAALTNEIGHNRAVVVNATINNTILILERLVEK